MSFACRFNSGSSAGGSSLSLSVSPSVTSGSGASTTSGALGPATATATGGSGAYTYLWSVGYNSYGGTVNIATPTASSTTVGLTGVQGQDTSIVTIRCTVRDAAGNTASYDVTFQFKNTNPAP